MAIGVITSPASWLNGTPVPPAWLQQVQDNINGWLGGTGQGLPNLVIGSSIVSTGVTGLLINGTSSQIRSAQTAVPVVSFGSGAGTGPSSASTIGTDTVGKLIITTGTAPAGSNATICTVTFSAPFQGANVVVLLWPGSTSAGAYAGLSVTSGNNSFSLISGAGALTASIGYTWHWLAIGI